MIHPIKTIPVFKQYIWGGSTLEEKYGKPIADHFAAESWEISCHKDGLCMVANGEFAGKTLAEAIAADPKAMVGSEEMGEFPLLLKLLDAKADLSVQVHPDDAYANLHENGSLGKTEMWYVISAEPGARLVYGVKDGVTREALGEAIEAGTPEELLNYVPVKAGDCFYIPAGTLHAIGAGLLIAEFQQSSNTTYRVYDYNRVGADGKKRELHVEKALDVIDFSGSSDKEKDPKVRMIGTARETELVNSEFFITYKYEIQDKLTVDDREGFELLLFPEGEGEIIYDGGALAVAPGDSVFIPAALDGYTVTGECELLRCYLPCGGAQ